MILIIIYLILLSWYLFTKIKKDSDLVVQNYGQIMLHFFTITSLFIVFVIFLRILRLFREFKVLDLNNVSFDLKFLILGLILIVSIRKLVIYRFKISWFKLHYLFMSPHNFPYYNTYQKYYVELIFLPVSRVFKHMIILNYFFTVIFFLFFSYDLLFNHLILNYSLWYLKYYSLFRLFYMVCNFMMRKQSMLLDFYSYMRIYPGDIDQNFFFTCKDLDHINLIQDSEKYNQGIILEKCEFFHKRYSDTREMKYFQEIRKK